MLFLIQYDRDRGQLVTFKAFEGAQRLAAETARLDLELALNHESVAHEVVLLEAATEKAVRRTHRRYFESLSELTAASLTGM